MTRMDVTPQLIEQIDFSEKFRGYDPDQVDDFLERVGATLSELMIRERDAAERADGLEQEVRQLHERAAAQPSGAVASAPASSTPMLTDEQEIEQASRTLLMAKRTADATISEARQEAAEMLATARSSPSNSPRRRIRIATTSCVGRGRTPSGSSATSATDSRRRSVTSTSASASWPITSAYSSSGSANSVPISSECSRRSQQWSTIPVPFGRGLPSTST